MKQLNMATGGNGKQRPTEQKKATPKKKTKAK